MNTNIVPFPAHLARFGEGFEHLSAERQARREAFINLPHYKRWLNKAGLIDSQRVLRSATPHSPRRHHDDPELPPLLMPPITQDDWVELLLDACAEYVTHRSLTVGVVTYYADAIPLPTELREFYAQDARVVLLGKKRNPQHLLVFSTPTDAFLFHASLEMDG